MAPDQSGTRAPEDVSAAASRLRAPQEILHALLLHGPQPDHRHVARLVEDAREGDRSAEGSVRGWIGTVKRNGQLVPGRLLEEKYVVFTEDHFQLGPGLGLMLSFSLGGEHLIAGLVDAAGDVVLKRRAPDLPGQTGQPAAVVMDRLRLLAAGLLDAAFAERPDLLCATAGGQVGLRVIGASAAWPAPMDHETRPKNWVFANDWHGHSFREHLALALDLPLSRVHCINDSKAAAMAIWRDQGADADLGTLLCINLSAGIGVGTLLQPAPVHGRLPFIETHTVGGRSGQAGEIGHVKVPEELQQSLNATLQTAKSSSQPLQALQPLDLSRTCNCTSDATGHVDAVFGAAATLTRVGAALSGTAAYRPGASLVAGLASLKEAAASSPVAHWALKDVGRGIGSMLRGAVAVLNPTRIRVIGAMAAPAVCDGMNDRFSASDLSRYRAELHEPDDQVLALRGAALAALRGALYRGFFDRIDHNRQPDDSDRPTYGYSGWTQHPYGWAQGSTAREQSAWRYTPMLITQANSDALRRRAYPAERRDKDERLPAQRPASPTS